MNFQSLEIFQSLSTKQKILIGFSFPILLVLALSGIMINSINEIGKNEAAVQHTREVLDDAAGISRSAVAMEAALRGYMLAGEEGLLEPYKSGEAAAYKGINALQKVVADNSLQVSQLDTLRKLFLNWQEQVAKPSMKKRGEIGDAKSISHMSSMDENAEGMDTFEQFRSQIIEFIKNEDIFLQEHRAEFGQERELMAKNFTTVDEMITWVNHTHSVISAADELLSNVLDIETGMRGYLLTGDEAFLGPYTLGRKNFLANVVSLTQAINENPLQVDRLKSILQTTQNWIDQVAIPAIQLRKSASNNDLTDLEDISALIRKEEGQAFYASFREHIEAFKLEEKRLLSERQQIVLSATTRVGQNLTAMSGNEKRVAHSIKVLKEANALLSAALDMETNIRGFLMSRKESFLLPYVKRTIDFDNGSQKLLLMVSGNPSQIALLKAATQTIKSWQEDIINPGLEIHREMDRPNGIDDFMELIGDDRGKVFLNEVQALMTAFVGEERRQMGLSDTARQATVQFTYAAIALITTIVMIIGFGLAKLIGNSIANPLLETTQAVERLANSDSRIMIPDTGRSDEMGTLIRAFNTMAERLHKQDAIVASEIEEREAAEKKAVAANIAKSEFLATMSHEIRTPLNGVLGMAQLLHHTELDAEQRTRVDTILTSGQSLVALINDVLDMSKIESGSVVLEEVAYDFAEMIRSVATVYQNLAQGVGLSFNLELELDGLTFMKGDEVRLKQVLLNLMGNALKFTRKGGVSLAVTHLAEGSPQGISGADHTVRLVISDTGKGISADRLPHIFDVFTQEDNSVTRQYGGSGLGLSIVKRLVELMGGKVVATSIENKGTEFILTVPFSRPSDKEVIALTQSKLMKVNKVQMKPLNIMVVEDNAVNASITKGFLDVLGHKVTLAANGKICIDYLHNGVSADLIFMDIHMPVMDGIKATRAIRSMYEREGTPIVGLTAEAFVNRHREFLSAGMDDILTKPFTEDQLIQTIISNVDMNVISGKVINIKTRENHSSETIIFDDDEPEIKSPIILKPNSMKEVESTRGAKSTNDERAVEEAKSINKDQSSTEDPKKAKAKSKPKAKAKVKNEKGAAEGNEAEEKQATVVILRPGDLPIGDDAQFGEIRKCLPPGEADRILVTAQDNLYEMMEDLRLGMKKSSAKIIKETAHAIKGAAGSLYAIRLAKMAQEFEDRSEEPDVIQDMMPGFEETASATIEWWKGHCELVEDTKDEEANTSLDGTQ